MATLGVTVPVGSFRTYAIVFLVYVEVHFTGDRRHRCSVFRSVSVDGRVRCGTATRNATRNTAATPRKFPRIPCLADPFWSQAPQMCLVWAWTCDQQCSSWLLWLPVIVLTSRRVAEYSPRLSGRWCRVRVQRVTLPQSESVAPLMDVRAPARVGPHTNEPAPLTDFR